MNATLTISILYRGDNVGVGFSKKKVSYVTNTPGDYQWRITVCNVHDQCSARYYDFHFTSFTPAYKVNALAHASTTGTMSVTRVAFRGIYLFESAQFVGVHYASI